MVIGVIDTVGTDVVTVRDEEAGLLDLAAIFAAVDEMPCVVS